ncbi:UNVERIFIED_CONTAM: hypothetical protein RMT77_016272 [Armadillidium vulgare]
MATGIFSRFSEEGSCTLGSLWNYIWKEHKIYLFATVAVVSAAKIHFFVSNKKKRAAARLEWDSAGQDVVVLHGFPRSKVCPNLSPYVLKLETYLRVAGIKYKFDSVHVIGPKGKSPWITLNGKDYSDSQLIIEFLGEKFQKNLSSRLSEEQKAVSRAMLIMNDEHLFWALPLWRFVIDDGREIGSLMDFSGMGPFVMHFLKRGYQRALWAQGLSRHSSDEIKEIIRKDLEAISRYLGQKPYLMGDTVTEVDCAIFGVLAQFVWGLSCSPFRDIIQKDFKNLERYCERIKNTFWSDWDDLLEK